MQLDWSSQATLSFVPCHSAQGKWRESWAVDHCYERITGLHHWFGNLRVQINLWQINFWRIEHRDAKLWLDRDSWPLQPSLKPPRFSLCRSKIFLNCRLNWVELALLAFARIGQSRKSNCLCQWHGQASCWVWLQSHCPFRPAKPLDSPLDYHKFDQATQELPESVQ